MTKIPITIESKPSDETMGIRNGNGVRQATVPTFDKGRSELCSSYELELALKEFALFPKCFNISEIMDWNDLQSDPGSVREALADDHRFIQIIGLCARDTDVYIGRDALFRWLVDLNIRLSKLGFAELTENELIGSMNSLSLSGELTSFPDTALQFGAQFGLVSKGYRQSSYVFPLSKYLMCCKTPWREYIAEFLEHLSLPTLEDDLLTMPVTEFVESGFSAFDDRIAMVVRAREGLNAEAKMTLEQIGGLLGVTRERIRQIEGTFWNRLDPMTFLVAGLVAEIARRRGSLIIDENHGTAAPFKFLLKCTGIPSVELKGTGAQIIGVDELNTKDFLRHRYSTGQSCGQISLVQALHPFGISYLPSTDVEALDNLIKPTPAGRRVFTKVAKVRSALERIGKPAHYSTVTQTYHQMYPDDILSERNVHAKLGSGTHGIVWVGQKGTYALKEWGSERPLKGYFDSVTAIVETRYKENCKPVTDQMIRAEIGKYRKLVNPNSLIIATTMNPAVRKVDGGYVPYNASDYQVDGLPGSSTSASLPGDKSKQLDEILKNIEGSWTQ